jgi:hypothetical protein
MSDFTLRSHGEMLTLFARSVRGRKRLLRMQRMKEMPTPPDDRMLLRREQAREIVEQLKFEGYNIEGEESI